jgi:hypothetical protein
MAARVWGRPARVKKEKRARGRAFFACPRATVANGWPPAWRCHPWQPTGARAAAGVGEGAAYRWA